MAGELHEAETFTAGVREVPPFPEELVAATRAELRSLLQNAGLGKCEARSEDAPQKFQVRLVQGLLRACSDPDHHFCTWWAQGVWLGSAERRLPRAPAIFERKTRWRMGYAEPDEISAW